MEDSNTGAPGCQHCLQECNQPATPLSCVLFVGADMLYGINYCHPGGHAAHTACRIAQVAWAVGLQERLLYNVYFCHGSALQMVALTCLLFTRDGASTQLAAAAATAAVPLLAIASYLTAHSLVVYMMGLWKFMK